MAASLVADYGESSDNTDDSDDFQTCNAFDSSVNETCHVVTSTIERSTYFFPANTDDILTDVADNGDKDKNNSSKPLEQAPKTLLPSFDDVVTETKLHVPLSSVFVNPYKAAEEAKQAILEKHVKLSENELHSKEKQICLKFKKGKCRFGKACKFSHNLNSVGSAQPDKELNMTHNNCKYGANIHQAQIANSAGNPLCTGNDNDIEFNAMKKQKKRPGLAKSLVPPKRVMTAYHKQQTMEKPWLTRDST